MSISLKTHKLLWARSGNRCAFEDCRCELTLDEFDVSSKTVIGEEAHIVAQKVDGPRGVSDMSTADRDDFNNLILLCRNHHKIIDDNAETYSVRLLIEMKSKHENWVNENLEFNTEEKRQELEISTIIDKWSEQMRIENWINWSSYIICHFTQDIEKNFYESFYDTEHFLTSRFYPSKYPEIEKALLNFRNVLKDFRHIYDYWRIDFHTRYRTEKFYKTNGGDSDEQLKHWYFHCYLISDLGLELTRAGNFVIETVRNSLYRKYRFDEGALLYDTIGLKRTEYKAEEKETLYPGICEFLNIRTNRDFSYGSGSYSEYEHLCN
jgi:hypothetical protein